MIQYFTHTLDCSECVLTQRNLDSLYDKCAENEDNILLEKLLAQAAETAMPKYIYAVCTIKSEDDNVHVSLRPSDSETVVFYNPLMNEKFKNLLYCFPYICTGGQELENWAASQKDIFASYLCGQIMLIYLSHAVNSCECDIKKRFDISENLPAFNPGSPGEWEIDGQRALFSIFGEAKVKKSIGVTLSESFLMYPLKSVSGIYFHKSDECESCLLCRRADCLKRRNDCMM